MASAELKDALKKAADKVGEYIANASELKVQTKTVVVGSGQAETLAASTVISFDGDNTTVLPTQTGADGKLEINGVLYDIHMQNVQAAIDYRQKLLDSVVGILMP